MSAERSGLITLTTDFGTLDGYVGAMKGAILRDHGGAHIVDVSHDVPPQDVVAGAFVLAQAAPHFPPGAVHVAVVDPGVGSARRSLIVDDGNALFVGPDNGLLHLAPGLGQDGRPAGRTVTVHVIDHIPPEWRVHPTFHGRDLFARVAARLAAGADVAEFSRSSADDAVRLAWPQPAASDGGWIGEVVHVDRFGNLVSNLTGDRLAPLGNGGTAPASPRFVVEIAGQRAEVVATYAAVEKGRLLAYLGSTGYLEVAVRDGSAADLLSASRGTRLRLKPALQSTAAAG